MAGMDRSGVGVALISDLDRRTVANLSIPTNVEKLTHDLRIDRHTKTRSEGDVYKHLERLEEMGLAKRLGEHDDLVKLAGGLPDDVRQMPDDQAEIFSRRLARPEHVWRTTGNLWVVTNDGVDRLHQPNDLDLETAAMMPSEMQAMVWSEWSRTLRDDPERDEDGCVVQSLTGALLHEEFHNWFLLVSTECRRIWNVDLELPGSLRDSPEDPPSELRLGGGAGYTDTYENSLIDAENQKTALGVVVDPWFMALTILAFTDTDTGTTADDGSHKPTYTGYARKSVAGTDMATASSGSSSNSNAITFAACTAGSSTVVGFGNCSTVTTGLLRKYGTCASTSISTTATPASFAAGLYSTSTD